MIWPTCRLDALYPENVQNNYIIEAGLLTYPILPRAFPTHGRVSGLIVGAEDCTQGDSQQRVCPGVSPGSLFTVAVYGDDTSLTPANLHIFPVYPK